MVEADTSIDADVVIMLMLMLMLSVPMLMLMLSVPVIVIIDPPGIVLTMTAPAALVKLVTAPAAAVPLMEAEPMKMPVALTVWPLLMRAPPTGPGAKGAGGGGWRWGCPRAARRWLWRGRARRTGRPRGCRSRSCAVAVWVRRTSGGDDLGIDLG